MKLTTNCGCVIDCASDSISVQEKDCRLSEAMGKEVQRFSEDEWRDVASAIFVMRELLNGYKIEWATQLCKRLDAIAVKAGPNCCHMQSTQSPAKGVECST